MVQKNKVANRNCVRVDFQGTGFENQQCLRVHCLMGHRKTPHNMEKEARLTA